MPELSGNGKVEQTGNTHFFGGVVQGVVRLFEKKILAGPSGDWLELSRIPSTRSSSRIRNPKIQLSPRTLVYADLRQQAGHEGLG